MIVRLGMASPRSQVILAKWVGAWRAASSQVEGGSTQAEAVVAAVKAWISIDQLS